MWYFCPFILIISGFKAAFCLLVWVCSLWFLCVYFYSSWCHVTYLVPNAMYTELYDFVLQASAMESWKLVFLHSLYPQFFLDTWYAFGNIQHAINIFPLPWSNGNIFTCFRKDVCFFRISRGYSYSHLVCNFLITRFSSLQPLQDVRNCLRCWRLLLQLLLVFPLFNPYKILEIAW